MRFPHVQTLLRKLRGKPTLVIGKGSSLGMRAQILNAGTNSECITVGENSRVEGELFVFAHGGRISIGDWCFVGPGSRIWSSCELTIGNRVLISHNCNVMDSLTHPLDANERHAQFKAIFTSGHPTKITLGEQAVHIGDDVWLGAGATVLRGVQVGRGAVIGAGSVVTHDVPPYTVVAGNPARVIRHINPET